MLKIGLIVFVIVTIIAGSGIGIGLRNKKRNEKEEALKEEFNLKGFLWLIIFRLILFQQSFTFHMVKTILWFGWNSGYS